MCVVPVSLVGAIVSEPYPVTRRSRFEGEFGEMFVVRLQVEGVIVAAAVGEEQMAALLCSEQRFSGCWASLEISSDL